MKLNAGTDRFSAIVTAPFGASGGLGGFSNHDEHGFHLALKRWQLKHEDVSDSPWQQRSMFA
jgi:hypothetical protein